MCEFCEIYQIAETSAENTKRETGVKTKFRIRLFAESFKDGISRSHVTYRPTKLVYCPECGRKLSEESKND